MYMKEMSTKQRSALIRIAVSSALLLFLLILSPREQLGFLLFMIPYLIVGYDILVDAFYGVLNRQPFDECFLMSIATIGAIILGKYSEAVAVMLFYQLGEFFQSYAVGKSRKNIQELMDIRPDYANIESKSGELIQVSPDELEPGTIIVIKPGEKVPIDGVIIEGSASINTCALTGESLPRDVFEGNELKSGSVNISGLLKLKTTKLFEESTASKILDLVENAGIKKSKQEKFISKFARIYTPFVCYSALALAIVPPLVSCFIYGNYDMSTWVYRALTFLVISCPCALVISVPLSFFAAIGGAGKAGILVKGSSYLETLSQVSEIVFDKTGTVTKGVFELKKIVPLEISESELLELAAHAEAFSDHPISRSIIKAYGKTPDENRIGELENIPGKGIVAKIDSEIVAVGNSALMDALGIEHEDVSEHGTLVHTAKNGKYLGYMLISDELRPNMKAAVSELKTLGIKRTHMLTGDLKSAALEVAEKAGISEVKYELLPQDKVLEIEKLMESKGKEKKIAYVGDGINDAPVLRRADVGIAMGGLGSDAAIESADIVIMDDDPMKIPLALRFSKKCMRIIYENIYFSIGIKFSFLILVAFGFTNMWYAIFADVGVMVIAVLNSLRALNVKSAKD
ncbi:MAG: cadmium-translocating P-type ATPase [Clostridiales bacterium]|nr:cadmium-translocating P-type ATPase [Clostridiales bacterium]